VTFLITSPPTNGTLYQYDANSGRGDPITTPGTPVTDSSRVVFTPSLDSFGAPNTTFGYLASDAAYNSDPALVNVIILPAPTVQSAGFGSNSNAAFALGFGGLSNAAYSVQASTNLVNWTRLGSASQPSPGQ